VAVRLAGPSGTRGLSCVFLEVLRGFGGSGRGGRPGAIGWIHPAAAAAASWLRQLVKG